MALLVPQKATTAGTTAVPRTASTSDTLRPIKGNVLHVKNGAGASTTLTIVVPGNTSYGSAKPDPTVTIAAGAETLLNLDNPEYADPDTGLITLTLSSATSVTYAYIG